MARIIFADFSTKRHQRLLARFSKRFVRKVVKVTEADILAGVPGAASNCPVALALKRLFPKAAQISVSRLGAFVWHPNGIRENWQPVEQTEYNWQQGPLSVYVHAFDQHQHIEPATFDLRLVSRLPDEYETRTFGSKTVEMISWDGDFE